MEDTHVYENNIADFQSDLVEVVNSQKSFDDTTCNDTPCYESKPLTTACNATDNPPSAFIEAGNSDTESYDSATPLLAVDTTAAETIDNASNAFVEAGHSDTESYDSVTPLLAVDTTAAETIDSASHVFTDKGHDETGSYDSETLLIPTRETHEPWEPQSEQTINEIAGKEEIEPLTYKDVTDNACKMETIPENGTCHTLLGHSNASMFDDIVTVVEEVKVTPLHIIGSGWEFGSISSIHRRPLEGVRSRSNTLESKTEGSRYKTEGDADSRLLSRVFSNQIGSIDILRKSTDGLDMKKFVSALSDSGKQDTESQEGRCGGNMKNVIAVSLGAMLLHTAVYGLRNLQSSMNSKEGIGVISMGIICVVYVFGSLISPFTIKRFGPKRCLVLGSAAHLFYIFANYYVTWLTIIPSSAIIGLGSALTWNAISTYITETGIIEAETKNKRSEHIISRYFGILFLSLQMSMVFGNLMSSLILIPKSVGENIIPQNQSSLKESVHNLSSQLSNHAVIFTSTPSNNESTMVSSEVVNVCGIGFCNEENAIARPIDDLDKLFLLGTYASCGILSVLVLYLCLDRIPNYMTRKSTTKEIAVQALAVVSMLVDKEYALVVPMCLYSYMSVGFVIADVLKAYITCPLDIYMVGYTMICFGLCGSVSSYAFGKIVKHTGRIPIFVIAALINIASIAAMAVWRPTKDDVNYLFVLIGAWGFADGIWQSQINSLISTVFTDRYETAFGTFRVLQGAAGMIVYGISSVFCMVTKLSITAAMCVVSLVCYMVMEFRRKRAVLVNEIYVNTNV